MSRHDLVAIVHGSPDLDKLPEVIGQSAQGFTVICEASPAPLIRLPRDRRALLQQAAHRQRLCEALMLSGTVLPALSHQTINLPRATDLIAANLPALEGWVTRFDGLVQYQITVTWDEPKVLSHFRTAPEIAPLYVRQAVTAEQIGRAVHDLADRLEQQMAQLLTPVAQESQKLPNAGNGLINMVLLLPSGAEAALDDAVAQIDAIWTEGLHIRQIGPGPAGSFLSLAAREVTAQKIHAAAQLLEADPSQGNTAIRQATKALLRQPGRHSTEDIRDAARILEASAHLDHPDYGLVLLEPWSEGSSQHDNRSLRVA